MVPEIKTFQSENSGNVQSGPFSYILSQLLLSGMFVLQGVSVPLVFTLAISSCMFHLDTESDACGVSPYLSYPSSLHHLLVTEVLQVKAIKMLE